MRCLYAIASLQLSLFSLSSAEPLSWSRPNDHGGSTQWVRTEVNERTLREERIVGDSAGTIRGTAITYYRDGKHLLTLLYRGKDELQFIEHWAYFEGGGVSSSLCTPEGKILGLQVHVPGAETETRFFSGDGRRELSDEEVEAVARKTNAFVW
ncbi:MAG: hypothetical protein AAF491_00250 [Verrucomicrobiota bacterium]